MLPTVDRVKIAYLTTQLFQSLEFLFTCLSEGSTEGLLSKSVHIGQLYGTVEIPSSAYRVMSDMILDLFEKYITDFDEELQLGWQTLINRVSNLMKLPKLTEERLLTKARDYLNTIANEQAWEDSTRERRWQEIWAEVADDRHLYPYL